MLVRTQAAQRVSCRHELEHPTPRRETSRRSNLFIKIIITIIINRPSKKLIFWNSLFQDSKENAPFKWN